MRVLWLILLLPLAGAEIVMEDPVGDQTFMVGPVEGDSSDVPYFDLVSASVEETKEDLIVTLEVDEIEPRTGEYHRILTWIPAYVHFTYADAEYAVEFARANGLLNDRSIYTSDLHRVQGERMDRLASMDTEVDEEKDTVTTIIDRDLIMGADGRPMQAGDTISAFWAEIDVDMSIFNPDLGVPSAGHYNDRMPDEGVSAVVVELQHGLQQKGHAFLGSESPYRISNGEATTFLYTVQASNTGDATDTFTFQADLPQDWIVTFPEERLRLEPGETQEVPVLVSVPFAHQHGSSKSFVLEMHSQTDPDSIGRLEMGVRYTEIPQPAGHHDTVYLHSVRGGAARFGDIELDLPFFGGLPGFMNTVEDHEFDAKVPVESMDVACAPTEQSYTYAYYLSPSLQMGLDFDLSRTGVAELAVNTPLPSQAVRVEAGLFVLPAGTDWPPFGLIDAKQEWRDHLVADLPITEPVATSAGQTVGFELQVVPTAAGDYVPFADQYLVYIVHVHDTPAVSPVFCVTGLGNEPVLAPGGRIQMPLDEYHDDVDEYFAAASGVDLYGEGLLKQFVNPGETALFNLTAEATGDGGRFDLRLTGANAEWARIVGGDSIDVKAGKATRILVAVTAPDSAPDGAIADISLVAASHADPNVQSVLRMVAEVDKDADHADATELVETLAADHDKASPGAGILMLLGLVLAARRR